MLIRLIVTEVFSDSFGGFGFQDSTFNIQTNGIRE